MKIIHVLKATVILLGMKLFLIVLTIIIPFLVQERLMLIFTTILLILTLFNGKITADREVTYIVNIEKDEE
ncbi:hypothetical protein [Enterococcus sp. AZ192]|uniref:hypothetical protein n=1 Tax=unclassified Enterococcus TaxID=2608891 RepID=UPI003D2AF0E4